MITFHWGGCSLQLKFSCFALSAFFCLFAGVPGSAGFLLAAALHEMGHLAALFLFHAPPKAAVFSALGCRVILDPEKRLGYGQNAMVSAAGPAVNLLSFALMSAAGAAQSPFGLASLALGVLHSLPIEPLDGGLALRALLCKGLPEPTAGWITLILSILLLIPLAVLGFLILLRTRYNFSLLALSLYLMLYLVLKRDYLED